MGTYRMYSLVLRQLSPMQKGIQSAHSIVEFGTKFHKLTECIRWSTIDKTMIVLDGGTYPELKEGIELLRQLGVRYGVFHEPDLGGIITSVSFLVEDKVWDSETYPSYDDIEISESDSSDYPDWLRNMGGYKNLQLRNFLKSKHVSN